MTRALAGSKPTEETEENCGAKLSTEGASPGESSGESPKKQEISPEETGRMPLVETDQVSEPLGGGVEEMCIRDSYNDAVKFPGFSKSPQ